MTTKYEFTEETSIANIIKKEVYELNNPDIRVNIRSRKGYVEPKDITIQYKHSQYMETLESKIESLKVLKTYCEGLRMRLFKDTFQPLTK